ncbi:hypothetical protein [Bordetella genomosp. 13]|uniref:Uncharacterized protein n=1 Tax=Bordetella genomosp. 13 TaxID=463040 RepID=A0A1W6Z9T0_9BORD|nr:hypothetical protein [Bordetella genomosp. 13]ARP94121.1 hypothetical protein CAL15_06820 [Bordetella genomosp. 13]
MKHTQTTKQADRRDDLDRQDQASHNDTQNRTKKDGHATNLGTGQDQQSARQRGQGARRS